MKIFAKIRFYWGSFIISFISAGIMIPLLYLFPRKKGEVLNYLNRIMMVLIGGKVIKEGDRDPNADMVMMNHQGIIDIVSMESIEMTSMRWVAKKELFDAIWFGNILRLSEMISIDRQNKSGLIKLLKDCRYTVENTNRAIAIFPEGTRTDKQELLSFKAGAKLVANRLKLKVQPVAITGSKLLLNEHNKTAHNATVKIIYLPTVDVATADDDWYEQISQTIQDAIDKDYAEYGRER